MADNGDTAPEHAARPLYREDHWPAEDFGSRRRSGHSGTGVFCVPRLFEVSDSLMAKRPKRKLKSVRR